MRVLLISTYEIGRQPFGLASPAAWLRAGGAEVTCLDVAVSRLDEAAVAVADLIAFYVPMHTATRIAISHLERVQKLNPRAHLCFFGLYAPVNADYLRSLGVGTVLGGEFETGLAALLERLQSDRPVGDEAVISTERQQFLVPDRDGFPSLDNYAKIADGTGQLKIVGYTEASRGCKHLCRHCPIVPVYGGRFRIVQRDVVLADIRQQVAGGAQHITFGDPDFFNGPGHAMAIVEALHEEFPHITYDVTIKVEHLRKQRDLLTTLRDTGCLFITSAVESVDGRTLEIYDKNHTRADFVEVATACRELGLTFNPTFVTFSPWTTLPNYADLLNVLVELDLVDNVAPIQFAIRLLIPAGSRLLELPEVQHIVEPFDQERLYYPWKHPDPLVDLLYEAVRKHAEANADRRETFRAIWDSTYGLLANGPAPDLRLDEQPLRPVPTVTEPWYCCAEPTDRQLADSGL